MNVLLINLKHLDKTNSAALQSIALAKGLLDLGYEVDYLTLGIAEETYNDEQLKFLRNMRVVPINEESIENTCIDDSNRKSGLFYEVSRFIWHRICVYDKTIFDLKGINCQKLRKHYELIISSSDPITSHLAVSKCLKGTVTFDRWIQYWGDPISIDISRKLIYPKEILKRIEKKIFKGADKIVYVSPFTAKEQKALFPKYADKMGFSPLAYVNGKTYESLENKKYRIGYFGAYNSNIRDILPFYNAMCAIDEKEVEVDIVGDSDISLKGKNNIRVLPRQSVDKFEAEVDLLVCILNRIGTQIPGKLYYLAGTNKPILVIVDGDNQEEMIQYLNSFNRYYVCNNSEEKILDVVKKIKNEHKVFYPLKKLEASEIVRQVVE